MRTWRLERNSWVPPGSDLGSMPTKVGADGGGRTHTLLRVPDFESSASANSATSARLALRDAQHYRRNAPSSKSETQWFLVCLAQPDAAIRTRAVRQRLRNCSKVSGFSGRRNRCGRAAGRDGPRSVIPLVSQLMQGAKHV